MISNNRIYQIEEQRSFQNCLHRKWIQLKQNDVRSDDRSKQIHIGKWYGNDLKELDEQDKIDMRDQSRTDISKTDRILLIFRSIRMTEQFIIDRKQWMQIWRKSKQN